MLQVLCLPDGDQPSVYLVLCKADGDQPNMFLALCLPDKGQVRGCAQISD